MNAAETIAAAITVLENDLTDTTWSYHHEVMSLRADGITVADGVMPPDGERITRWQRTLKAQLAILRDALGPAQTLDKLGIPAEGEPWGQEPVFDLARAILGED